MACGQEALLHKFAQPPTYLGPATTLDLVTEGGRRYVDMAGELKEVGFMLLMSFIALAVVLVLVLLLLFLFLRCSRY